MDVRVTSDFDKFIKDVGRLNKQHVPFAISKTLNDTAFEVRGSEIDVMQSIFDRPTNFIMKALRVKKGKKNSPDATVAFNGRLGKDGEAVDKVLLPQIKGGKRKLKGSERTLRRHGVLGSNERIVPSRALRLNKHGNITKGLMNKILSNIGEQSDSSANTPLDKRTTKYIVGEVGGTRGIWSVSGKKQDRWKPVLIFVREPNYRKRFPFYKTAERVMHKRVGPNFKKAMDFAIRTSR
jgi:hypothetical protein